MGAIRDAGKPIRYPDAARRLFWQWQTTHHDSRNTEQIPLSSGTRPFTKQLVYISNIGRMQGIAGIGTGDSG